MACPHGQRLSRCRECGNGRWRTKRKEDDYHVITLEATAVEEYEAAEEPQFELPAEVQQGYRAQDHAHAVWIVANYSGLADSQTGLRDTMPHTLRSGEKLVLSRLHMQRPKLTVSREQCKVTVAADGTADLVSCGKGPTLLRQSGSPWYAISRSDTCPLADGDQISLDCNDPEAAVFTCHQVDSAGQRNYPQQTNAQGGGVHDHAQIYEQSLQLNNAPRSNVPQGYAPQGYAPQGYAPQGYAPQSSAPRRYAPQGYAPHGYPPHGYAQQIYAPHGYPPQGYTQQVYPQGAPCMAVWPLHPSWSPWSSALSSAASSSSLTATAAVEDGAGAGVGDGGEGEVEGKRGAPKDVGLHGSTGNKRRR